MAKRMLNCTASELRAFTAPELLSSIRACEGRILACETIGTVTPLLGDVANAECAAAMGADLLLLNIFDVQNPVIQGLPATPPGELVRELKRLTGRMIGINLEPVSADFLSEDTDALWKISPGRIATPENARLALEMGVDMVLLTGNPGNGVTNKAITDSLKAFREVVGDRMILAAGKMHASEILSESGERIIGPGDVDEFLAAGADIILFPAPGTVPGLTTEYIRSLIQKVHASNKLAMTAIGTSQEGADVQTIRQIALMCKMAGADIHHLGDSAYTGISLPENILAYSIAIRGVRHTYRRMAMSINR